MAWLRTSDMPFLKLMMAYYSLDPDDQTSVVQLKLTFSVKQWNSFQLNLVDHFELHHEVNKIFRTIDSWINREDNFSNYIVITDDLWDHQWAEWWPSSNVVYKRDRYLEGWNWWMLLHYNDVIMRSLAFQITSLTIVYLNVYSRRRSKKTSKLRVPGLCAGNSPLTGEFPA